VGIYNKRLIDDDFFFDILKLTVKKAAVNIFYGTTAQTDKMVMMGERGQFISEITLLKFDFIYQIFFFKGIQGTKNRNPVEFYLSSLQIGDNVIGRYRTVTFFEKRQNFFS
jgi:hypothetical protein